jgi:hypothetical protein
MVESQAEISNAPDDESEVQLFVITKTAVAPPNLLSPEDGVFEVLLPSDHPLEEYRKALKRALHVYPENQRAAVYTSVLAAFNLTRAMYGNDLATPFGLLLGALQDLEHGRVHDLFTPNPNKPDTHPIGTNEWCFRAVAAACLTAVHQATGNLRNAAEQVASWYQEGGHAVSSRELIGWRKDLQRTGDKRALTQRKRKDPAEPQAGLGGAKPLYQFTTRGLLKQLSDQGPEALINHLRQTAKYNVRM